MEKMVGQEMQSTTADNNNRSQKTKEPEQHKCGTCGKICLTACGLVKHITMHTRENTIECDICSKKFSQPHCLKKHRITHDKDREREHECPTCHKKFFNQSGLNSHRRRHNTTRPYSCDVCGSTYKYKASLLRHKIIHTGKKPHVCKTCGKSFSYPNNLYVHSFAHSGVKKYFCNICNRSFAYNSCLIRHKKSHSGLKPYVCEYCGRRAAYLNGLTQHKKIHTKPFVCGTCGKAFGTKGGLQNHQLGHTEGRKVRFKCDACMESIPSYLISIHRKECPDGSSYSCNICGEKLSRWKEIQEHSRIHGSKKLLKCHICLKQGFPVLSKLREHLLTHSEDQTYQCDLCEKSFHSLPHLTQHRKSCSKKNPDHPCFSCDICHATFTTGDAMNLHKKNIHSLEDISKTSHKCSLCERTFQTLELLNAHKQYHAGQRMSDVVSHDQFDNKLDDEMDAEQATGVTYACFKCGMEFELMKELIEHDEHHCSH